MGLKLEDFEATSLSSYKLGLSRVEHFVETKEGGGSGGLAKELVDQLTGASDSWKDSCLQRTDDNTSNDGPEATRLLLILSILRNVCDNDAVLSEEVAHYEESSVCLRQLMEDCVVNSDTKSGVVPGDSVLQELNDLATPIRAAYAKDILKNGPDNALLPYTNSELQSRLPMVFSTPQPLMGDQAKLEILIHQSTDEETEQHDTGFVMWPSSVTLARWIAMHPTVVWDGAAKGGILELGAGCGLVGLTAATLLKQSHGGPNQDTSASNNITMTDYNPTVLRNLELSIRLNDLDTDCTMVTGLDFFDQNNNTDDDDCSNNDNSKWVDMDGTRRSQVGLILAADVICYSNDAELVANTIKAALAPNGLAIVISADANRRFGVEHFPEACYSEGLEVEVIEIVADQRLEGTSVDEQTLLMHDLGQTSGFVEGYNQLMFKVCNPA